LSQFVDFYETEQGHAISHNHVHLTIPKKADVQTSEMDAKLALVGVGP
jgi:hypothetical protein